MCSRVSYALLHVNSYIFYGDYAFYTLRIIYTFLHLIYPVATSNKIIKIHWQKTEEAPIVMYISNCGDKSGRMEYIQELMKHIKVDSNGKCLHNKVIFMHQDCKKLNGQLPPSSMPVAILLTGGSISCRTAETQLAVELFLGSVWPQVNSAKNSLRFLNPKKIQEAARIHQQ